MKMHEKESLVALMYFVIGVLGFVSGWIVGGWFL